jgi:hypothetical protein
MMKRDSVVAIALLAIPVLWLGLVGATLYALVTRPSLLLDEAGPERVAADFLAHLRADALPEARRLLLDEERQVEEELSSYGWYLHELLPAPCDDTLELDLSPARVLGAEASISAGVVYTVCGEPGAQPEREVAELRLRLRRVESVTTLLGLFTLRAHSWRVNLGWRDYLERARSAVTSHDEYRWFVDVDRFEVDSSNLAAPVVQSTVYNAGARQVVDLVIAVTCDHPDGKSWSATLRPVDPYRALMSGLAGDSLADPLSARSERSFSSQLPPMPEGCKDQLMYRVAGLVLAPDQTAANKTCGKGRAGEGWLVLPTLERVRLGGRCRIGRVEESDLVVSEDDPTVAPRHAEVRWAKGGFHIADLGSANGVFVEGEQVSLAPLGSPSLIQLGDTRLVFVPTRDTMP